MATHGVQPLDENGNVINVQPLDFNQVLDGLVALAATQYEVVADSIYRLVGATDIYYLTGDSTVAAITINGTINSAWLPANTVQYVRMKAGQTTLSVASEFADGGCFNAVRVG